MSLEAFKRQRDLIPQEKLQQMSVEIVGAGATGSFVALALAKMGIGKITIWDHDTIALHNTSNQFYSKNQVGKNKARVLAKWLNCLSPDGATVQARGIKFRTRSKADIMILCVDSLRTRYQILAQHQGLDRPDLFIDCRIGALTAEVLVVKWYRLKYLMETLLPLDKVVQEACTARSIIYAPIYVASEISAIVRQYVCGLPFPARTFKDFSSFQYLTMEEV